MTTFLIDCIMRLWGLIHHQKKNLKVKNQIKSTGVQLTGPYSKYQKLFEFLETLSREEYTGEVKINYHKGNFSKKLSVKHTKEI